MPDELLTVDDAARRLGLTAATVYAWLGLSDRGLLVIRGEAVTVGYYQGGPRGQGRIRVPAVEVGRLLERMRVTPQPLRPRRTPVRRDTYPGITVPLGRPNA